MMQEPNSEQLETEDRGLRRDDGVRALSITSLALTHFRNYLSARIEISPSPVVLTGRNGAGKTNILEAVSLLAPGRGLRRARLFEIDHLPLMLEEDSFGVQEPSGQGFSFRKPRSARQPWTIASYMHGMQGPVQVGTGRDPEAPEDAPDKRLVKIAGKPAKSQAELARHFAVVWLTPQMEQLFNEGATAARKFLDRLVYSFDPDHAARVNEYEFAMRERNKLLQNPRADAVWLDALEQTVAETGGAIASARLHTVEHINQAIRHSPLSFPKAHIAIGGVVEDLLALGAPAVQVEEDFKSILKAGRPQDAAAGRTLMGIHRSELAVTHSGRNMPAIACSTGEQKALLLSIVLAQARAGAQWHGVIPVLLLDEVVAHLDESRRHELFDEICHVGAQAWMTGTDASLFAGLFGRAQYFHVEQGELKPV